MELEEGELIPMEHGPEYDQAVKELVLEDGAKALNAQWKNASKMRLFLQNKKQKIAAKATRAFPIDVT